MKSHGLSFGRSKVHNFFVLISKKAKKSKAESSGLLLFKDQGCGGGGVGGIGGLGGISPESPGPSSSSSSSDIVITWVNGQFVLPGIWFGLWHSITQTR